MEIPFIGGAYIGRSTNLNAQVCQNLYPVVDQQGGKTVLSLTGIPGLTSWYNTGTEFEMRGFFVMGDFLYFVCGMTAYMIDINGTCTTLGTIDTSSGQVWITGDGTNVMFVDGTKGYYYDQTTFREAYLMGFIPSSLTYQDGYFICSKADTDRFHISSLRDPSTWDALDYATAEGHSDNLVCVISQNRDLWLFGTETTEIWFNSGAATFPFERYQGGFVTIGCKSARSVAKSDDRVFWLDNDLRVRMGVGIQSEVISTPQIDYQISLLSNYDEAVGFYYIQDGHGFYQLTIADKTLVYDVSTGFWHSRASGARDSRHPAQCYAYFGERHLVGHESNGKILYFNPDVYSNDGEYLRAIRACQVVHSDRKLLFHDQFEIEFDEGVGITGSENGPMAMLQWSDDGGKRWSNEHWTSIGKIGEYTNRAIWRRLGRSRERIYKVTISDAIKRTIIAGNLEASVGTT